MNLLIVFGIIEKPGPDRDPGPKEKQAPWKNRTSKIKSVAINIKDNVEVIPFHIKRRGVQGHVFVPIMLENCTLNFYFENGEFSIKKTIANLQPFLAWNVSAS